MKRPAIQFYFKDHCTDRNLRRCSPAARGFWIDVMAVLHDSEEYGVVRWPLRELADAAKVPMRYMRELVDKSVLKGSDEGIEAFVFTPKHGRALGKPVTLIEKCHSACWFCARFVRDEYVRNIRGSDSRFTRSDNVFDAPKVPIGARIGADFGDASGDGPASASASASALAFDSTQDCGTEASTQLSRVRARDEGEAANEPQRLALECCAVMERAGVHQSLLDPEHPFLTAAILDGATPGMFDKPARKGLGVNATNAFAYACKAVSGMLLDARSGRQSREPEARGTGAVGLGALLQRAIGMGGKP